MNSSHPFINRRVLVIDDNPSIHEDFRKILSKAFAADDRLDDLESTILETQFQTATQNGFEIDSAFQGEEGLAKVRVAVGSSSPYAVVFVDMRMPPGWDGVETIAQLRQVDPRLQIVICTAYSDYSWEEILHQLGTRCNLMVLKKPFDNIEVIQICETLTEKWSLTQQLQAADPASANAEKWGARA